MRVSGHVHGSGDMCSGDEPQLAQLLVVEARRLRFARQAQVARGIEQHEAPLELALPGLRVGVDARGELREIHGVVAVFLVGEQRRRHQRAGDRRRRAARPRLGHAVEARVAGLHERQLEPLHAPCAREVPPRLEVRRCASPTM